MLWGSMESEPKADAAAEDHGGGEGGHAGVDVHDVAAGEVQRPHRVHPAAAPDPVGHGSVDQGDPKHGEQHVGLELHALGEGARDEGGGDDGKHALKDHESLVGNVVRVRPGLGGADVVEAHEFKAADEAADIRAEGQRVAPEHPNDAHDAHAHEAVHHGGGGVLAARQAAVEQRQPRRHQQHERGADQHPRHIRLIHGRQPRLCRARPAVRRANGWRRLASCCSRQGVLPRVGRCHPRVSGASPEGGAAASRRPIALRRLEQTRPRAGGSPATGVWYCGRRPGVRAASRAPNAVGADMPHDPAAP